MIQGKPILEYESLDSLFEFLNVPFLPKAHWSDNRGWIMAKFIYGMVRDKIRTRLSSSDFLVITADKTTSCDNGSWLSIHAYFCKDWKRMPYMPCITKVFDAPNANNLLEVILEGIEKGVGVGAEAIERMLLCFGTFQGCWTGVTTQLQQKIAPYSIELQCWAHRINLAAQTPFALPIFRSNKELIQKCWESFNHSAKRLSEFQELTEMIEIKELCPLKNVATKWVSLLEPLRRVVSEYRMLIAKSAMSMRRAVHGSRFVNPELFLELVLRVKDECTSGSKIWSSVLMFFGGFYFLNFFHSVISHFLGFCWLCMQLLLPPSSGIASLTTTSLMP